MITVSLRTVIEYVLGRGEVFTIITLLQVLTYNSDEQKLETRLNHNHVKNRVQMHSASKAVKQAQTRIPKSEMGTQGQGFKW